MFGHEAKPSRIYSYGAFEPVEGLEKVREQLLLAHRYKNERVALELERRKRCDEALKKLAPDLTRLEGEAIAAGTALNEARDQQKRANAAIRRRGSPAAALREEIAHLRQVRGEAWKKFKTTRTALYEDPRWRAIQAEIDEWNKTEIRARYNKAREAGLSWGTACAINQSMGSCRKGPPPRFRRWDGGRKLAVQIQLQNVRELPNGKRTKGRPALSGLDLLAGRDSRLKVETYARPRAVPGSKRSKKLAAFCWFRVGDNADGSPAFAKIPFILHRAIPEHAEVKWAYLLRFRRGAREVWEIQFVLAQDSWEKLDTKHASGSVGIDIGWRVMEDRRLRVAVWSGSDGREGELALRPGWIDYYRRTEHIRGVRDKNFETARDTFAKWLEGREVPEWLLERLVARHKTDEKEAATVDPKQTITIATWRSIQRLKFLVQAWATNRFDRDDVEDEVACLGECAGTGRTERSGTPILCPGCLGRRRVGMFSSLQAWVERDHHLLEYEGHLRDQLQANRLDLYRNFAAQIRRSYKTAIVEGASDQEKSPAAGVRHEPGKAPAPGELMDLRPFHMIPPAEAPSTAPGVEGSQQKEHVRDACLSLLRQLLAENVEITTKPAPQTTQECHACGSIEAWNQAELMHACVGCGVSWDQDVNAARNLLKPPGAPARARATEPARR